MNTDEERTWATLAHLSPYVGYFTAILGWVPPLVIWLLFKDRSEHVSAQAKEALNLQITLFIAMFISSLLVYLLIGLVLVPLVLLAYLILPIVGAMHANDPAGYRYPGILRIIP